MLLACQLRHFIFGLLLVTALRSVAGAQEFPEPSNRRHTLDIYRGAAFGSARTVGMGGAATATALGAKGMFANAAAAGVRLSTSNDTWDWDGHLQVNVDPPGIGTDYDNNGIPGKNENFHPSQTGGLVLQYKDWGLGMAIVEDQTDSRFADTSGEQLVRTITGTIKLSLAHYMLDSQLVVGVGSRTVFLRVESGEEFSDEAQELVEVSGEALDTGILWKPNGKSYRLGATFSFPIVAKEMAMPSCDLLDCGGYIVPEKLKAPWIASIGIAGRRAPTPWNIRYTKSPWRDEKALLWAVDLVLTGTTQRGVGIEAFTQHMLQPSGRKHSLSLRGGAEYEWVPGTFRIRGGAYYEPSRFKDPVGNDISGRPHLTAGFDWTFWSFGFWGNGYRPYIGYYADGAKDFLSTGVSFGFWH